MRDIKDDLKDIYRDFYGPGSDDDTPRIDHHLKRDSAHNDRRRDLPDNKITPKDDHKDSSDFQELETEVVTQTEFKVQTAPAAKEEKPAEPEKSGMEELNELIGLKTVKHDVEELVGLAKVRKMRQEKGMKTVPVSLHLVFSGNPGTGKTTVARILAKLYKEIGILSTGQLVETDRSGLVAGYVGQTAIKTQGKIEEAMGGVLFIDEAYTLNQEGENFGQEAIDTILKAMEDHRDEFVVIVAGYTELMKAFVESNPGLRSRFNKFFEFPDYTVDELQAIFDLQCKKYQYKLTEEAEKAVREEIIRLEAFKGENFANAREVRNLFEKIITNQAARVSNLENVDEETLTTITIEDLKDSEDPADNADTIKLEVYEAPEEPTETPEEPVDPETDDQEKGE
ncbi:MAG: AAA family ATPase [Mogibacterium sp.]|nr:AAA family ATPase [Mogibacterium sp.]